jgi:hypothetical protein
MSSTTNSVTNPHLTFAARAAIVAGYGVPVMPVKPRSKEPVLNDWQNRATTDPVQIAEWNKQNPAYNCGAVGRTGGFWILDIDDPTLFDRIEKETGHNLEALDTLVVSSSGSKRHFYFKHDDRSESMGNFRADGKDGEMFSVRGHNAYVVSAGSIHPKTGQPYEVITEPTFGEIPTAPDWLMDWLLPYSKRSSAVKTVQIPETIPEGSRNNTLLSLAGAMRRKGANEAEITAALRVMNQLRCQPPMSDAELATIAKSVAKYPAAEAPAAQVTQSSGSGGQDAAHTAIVVATPAEDVPIAAAGITDMPESVLDGWLGGVCKSRMLEHFPVAYAWTALVTVASSMVPLVPNSMRCNLYGCPVGAIHTGKTEAITHAKRLLDMKFPTLLDLMVGSAEMLTSAVADADGQPRLYSPDELGHLLEKAQIQNSSFVYVVNRAFYETGFRIRSTEQKGKETSFNATLSILGGIVDERFGDLFTSKTTGGFYDRFLYGLCPTGFQYFYLPFEGGPALQTSQVEDDGSNDEAIVPFSFGSRRPVPVTLDKSVFYETNRWMRDDEVLKNPDCGRIVEIAMRVAVICASFDMRPVLYGKDLGPAYELARYQARIRGVLKPNPGMTFEGQLYHKFFESLTMHTSDGKWMPRRELFHNTRAHEIGLDKADRTLDTMIANEDVEELRQPGKSGPPKKFVRIARKPKVRP